ncbi:hypothetical protein BLA24_00025 [Streptomyces cinnamoneus]|nr:GNAT family protein [Streptomyces cinnamoneus]PHQ53594.1 hypothetical protein BLA24_00025 [Streptomyces cinnamoneus]
MARSARLPARSRIRRRRVTSTAWRPSPGAGRQPSRPCHRAYPPRAVGGCRRGGKPDSGAGTGEPNQRHHQQRHAGTQGPQPLTARPLRKRAPRADRDVHPYPPQVAAPLKENLRAVPLRLAGDAVVLRDFTMDDVDDALKIVGDDRVTTWLSFDSRDRQGTQEMLEGAISRAQREPRDEYYLAIVAPPSDHVIGFCRIGLSGVRAGKLGYAVAASEWGKGYATDAARTMIDFGFRTLGLHRISAAIGPDNLASINLIERLGFTREGVLRDHVHTNGVWRDSILFSTLAKEWPESQSEGPKTLLS